MGIRNFKDKVAVITGAGSGIGQALALDLAARGCNMALADVKKSGLNATRKMLAETGVEASLHVVDVSDEASMRAFADAVATTHGQLNLLFNNAGITLAKTFEGHALKDWEKIIGINLWGLIYGCHFFLPLLQAQAGEAHIVNMSSMVAFMGAPQQTSYSATKSAIKGFGEALWAELHGEGIGVTTVLPGAIRTQIMTEALKSAEDKAGFAKTKSFVDKAAMPVDKAVKQIIKAVKKDRMRVVIGMDAMLFETSKRLFPEQANKVFLLQDVFG